MNSIQSKIYSISDFWQWHDRKELILSPKFQRREIWSGKAKSYLMDTIVRGLPIPKIFMRNILKLDTKKTLIEIVDGQQRLSTILSFLNDGFTILAVHNKPYGKKYYSELPNEIKQNILEFNISVDILTGLTEKEILDIFARINTYTLTLSKQEILNSKYFGAFKQVVYSLGYEFVDFWVNNKVISEKQIARMGEAEFATELVIQLLDGVQDRKTIESYYKKYDDKFAQEKEMKREFKNNIDLISNIFGDRLKFSNFRKRPLFYSLFGVINDLKSKRKMNKTNYPKILSLLSKIDDILNQKPEDIPQKYFKFYDASTKHVTDLKARKVRKQFLVKKLSDLLN